MISSLRYKDLNVRLRRLVAEERKALQQLATATFAMPRPGRRIGLAYRESAGRAAAYERFAAMLTDMIIASVPTMGVVPVPTVRHRR